MNKKLITILVGCISNSALALNSGINAGPSMTTGPSLSHFSVQNAMNNPALNPFMVPEGDKWRMAYFGSFGTNIEVGDVNNFADDVDDLADILDDPDSTDEETSDVLDRFNDVLVRMGESGYIKSNTLIHVPVTPLYYHSERFNGTFGLDVSIGTQIAGRILDDTLRFNPATAYETSTSLYMKSGIETRISLSFGGQYLEDHAVSSFGDFYAGVKVNLIQLELSKQIIAIQDFDGNDVGDIISDNYDNNLESSWNVGIDLGVMWDAERYRVGVALENLNSPGFDYGSVGVNCTRLDENTTARNSCEVAALFVARGRLDPTEEHKMNARLRADGLYKLTDTWSISGSLDLAKYDDVVGFENQWMHVGASYESSKGWWRPSARVGYQKNLAGEKLSSLNVGFTFFKMLTLDGEYGLETIEVDGSSGPRRFGFSIGIEEKF